MTEKDSEEAPVREKFFAPDIDWFLQQQVGTANRKSGFGVSLTLTVGGFLVSGVLVSGEDFIKDFGEKLANALGTHFDDEEIKTSIEESYKMLREGIYSVPEDERPEPVFIHMRDVRFFTAAAQPIPTQDGMWWRGKMSDVSGFSLGAMNMSSD